MSATQLAIIEAGPTCDPSRAQWLTPPALARELVALAGTLLDDARRRQYQLRVLEPSAGRGNLVRAVLDRCPHAQVDAVDVDPRWRGDLEALGAQVHVEIVDYLERPPPAERYDLAVTNPPFDAGEETAHLAKLMDEANRIVALLPARSLHGRERYKRIWRRCDPANRKRDWWIREQVHLISRPKFGERGGTDEIVIVRLHRTPGPCEMRWL